MKHLIDQNDLNDRIYCDSAGTSSVHRGERPDSRSSAYALKRGVVLDSRSRPFDKIRDFDEFDLILVMDKNNYKTIMNQDINNIYSDKVVAGGFAFFLVPLLVFAFANSLNRGSL